VYEIDNSTVPLGTLSIGGRDIAVFAPFGYGSWALVNLILTIAGILLVGITTFRALRKKKREDEELASDYEGDKKSRTRLYLLAAAAIASIAMVLVFIITQNMRNPMVLIDWWSIVHAVVMIAQVVAILFVFKRNKKNNHPYWQEGELEPRTEPA